MNSFWEQSVCHIFLILCLTGAFSTLLEIVNSRNAARCWLAECVRFLLESMHWEHLREAEKRGRETKKESEVDWGKENGGASWCWAEEIFSGVCSLFIRGGQLFICCLDGRAETEREMMVWGRRRQAELLGTTWNGCKRIKKNIKKGGIMKKQEKDRNSGRIKLKRRKVFYPLDPNVTTKD